MEAGCHVTGGTPPHVTDEGGLTHRMANNHLYRHLYRRHYLHDDHCLYHLLTKRALMKICWIISDDLASFVVLSVEDDTK